jgi:hypothetical protein
MRRFRNRSSAIDKKIKQEGKKPSNSKTHRPMIQSRATASDRHAAISCKENARLVWKRITHDTQSLVDVNSARLPRSGGTPVEGALRCDDSLSAKLSAPEAKVFGFVRAWRVQNTMGASTYSADLAAGSSWDSPSEIANPP